MCRPDTPTSSVEVTSLKVRTSKIRHSPSIPPAIPTLMLRKEATRSLCRINCASRMTACKSQGPFAHNSSDCNNRCRASATYFYTELQKVIIFDFSGLIDPATDPFGRFGGYVNTKGGIARGIELSLTATPARTLNISVAYTLTKSLQRRPQLPGILRSLGIPDHQFSLVATQRIGRRVLVNFDLSASRDYLAPIFNPVTFGSRAYRFRGLAKADLGGSYTLPFGESRSLRFFGYVDNLFDREYFESGFRTPGRTGRAGATFVF